MLDKKLRESIVDLEEAAALVIVGEAMHPKGSPDQVKDILSSAVQVLRLCGGVRMLFAIERLETEHALEHGLKPAVMKLLSSRTAQQLAKATDIMKNRLEALS